MRSVTDRDPRPCRPAGGGSTGRGLSSMSHGWWSHRDPAGQPPGLPVPASALRRTTGAGERVPVRQRVPNGRRRRPRGRLTPTGFVAEAVLATARGDENPPADERRQVVLELMQARAQLRRYGNNINQAARVLNAGGQPPEWLAHAVALTNRVVGDIDEAVQDLLAQPHGR
jgi:hypothetical protein